jgi:hypothetical protein
VDFGAFRRQRPRQRSSDEACSPRDQHPHTSNPHQAADNLQLDDHSVIPPRRIYTLSAGETFIGNRFGDLVVLVLEQSLPRGIVNESGQSYLARQFHRGVRAVIVNQEHAVHDGAGQLTKSLAQSSGRIICGHHHKNFLAVKHERASFSANSKAV